MLQYLKYQENLHKTFQEVLKEPHQKILKNKLPQLKQDETTTFKDSVFVMVTFVN